MYTSPRTTEESIRNRRGAFSRMAIVGCVRREVAVPRNFPSPSTRFETTVTYDPVVVSAFSLHDLHVFFVPRKTSRADALDIERQNGHVKIICLQSGAQEHLIASLATHAVHIPCKQHVVSTPDLLHCSTSQNADRHTPHSSPMSSLVLTLTSTNPLKNLVVAVDIF